MNIIGFGSFIYLISSYLGCAPKNRNVFPVYFKIGGCPYNQTTRDPTKLRIRICNISVRKRVNNIS